MAAFEDNVKEGDTRKFAGLKGEGSRIVFTKIANSRRWGNGRDDGMVGPRFVHRSTTLKTVMMSTVSGPSVMQSNSLPASVLVETNLVELAPTLAKSLTGLSLEDGAGKGSCENGEETSRTVFGPGISVVNSLVADVFVKFKELAPKCTAVVGTEHDVAGKGIVVEAEKDDQVLIGEGHTDSGKLMEEVIIVKENEGVLAATARNKDDE